jgi:hypothetical protein
MIDRPKHCPIHKNKKATTAFPHFGGIAFVALFDNLWRCCLGPAGQSGVQSVSPVKNPLGLPVPAGGVINHYKMALSSKKIFPLMTKS